MNMQRRQSAFTVWELVCVIAIGAILLAIAWPHLFGHSHGRHAARIAVCDNIYVALNGEARNELDTVLRGGTTSCGTTSGNAEVVECLLSLHTDEDNPRNRNQTAYAPAAAITSNAASCRVGLQAASTNRIRFNQFVQQGSSHSRTFSVVFEGP